MGMGMEDNGRRGWPQPQPGLDWTGLAASSGKDCRTANHNLCSRCLSLPMIAQRSPSCITEDPFLFGNGVPRSKPWNLGASCPVLCVLSVGSNDATAAPPHFFLSSSLLLSMWVLPQNNDVIGRAPSTTGDLPGAHVQEAGRGRYFSPE
jgi:hypothetical protein